MILKAYAIYDIKGDVYLTPFFFAADGQAIRAFQDLANDSNTVVGRHPGDYKLCRLGKFDDSTGVLLSDDAGSLGFAAEYVEKKADIVPVGRKVS